MIKVLCLYFVGDVMVVWWFVCEVKGMFVFDIEYVVCVVDFGVIDGGFFYMVMEYFDGWIVYMEFGVDGLIVLVCVVCISV